MFYKHCIFLSFIFIFSIPLISSAETEALFKIDFTKAHGRVDAWFKNHGWQIEGDFEDMNARFENGSLVLEPTDDGSVLMGLEFKKNEFLNDIKYIKIIWGVGQYPVGADWSGPKERKRNTREPIAVIIFFGEEKIDSGGTVFPPDAPYFIGLFLGKLARPGITYLGNYYQKGGRYFCESCNGSIGQFTTIVNIHDRFKSAFGKNAPPITKLSIEVDVEGTEKVNGRYSKAYLKSIEMFK